MKIRHIKIYILFAIRSIFLFKLRTYMKLFLKKNKDNDLRKSMSERKNNSSPLTSQARDSSPIQLDMVEEPYFISMAGPALSFDLTGQNQVWLVEFGRGNEALLS